MPSGIVEIDVHGLNCEQALLRVEREVKTAHPSVYRLRIIHGYHGGTRIKEMLLEEFGYERNEKVRRIIGGGNQGITELVLREY